MGYPKHKAEGPKMAEQMYLEFPLKPEYVEDFFELCNSELGFALTKKQPGFVSAEWMISTSENGSKCLHLWEKWQSVQAVSYTHLTLPTTPYV